MNGPANFSNMGGLAPFSETIPSDIKLADRIHRYPAKMTPKIAISFMDMVRDEYGDEEVQFFDPMCGSGTTALIARWKGAHVSCSDALFPASIIASAKISKLGANDLELLNSALKDYGPSGENTPLYAWPNWDIWFSSSTLRGLQDINEYITQYSTANYYPHILTALYHTIWDLSSADKGVIVPTRSKFSRTAPTMTGAKVFKEFQRRLDIILVAQQALTRLNIPEGHVDVHQGNALSLSAWPSRKLDVILTSPPYGCGLDYPRAFRLQMKACHQNENILDLSSMMIGRIKSISEKDGFEMEYLEGQNWYKQLRDISQEKRKVLLQYLVDMDNFFSIVSKRLKNDGKLGVLIGNPEMQRIRIPLNEILLHLALENGLIPQCEVKEDRIKSRIQNFKLRSATSSIASEYLLIFSNN